MNCGIPQGQEPQAFIYSLLATTAFQSTSSARASFLKMLEESYFPAVACPPQLRFLNQSIRYPSPLFRIWLAERSTMCTESICLRLLKVVRRFWKSSVIQMSATCSMWYRCCHPSENSSAPPAPPLNLCMGPAETIGTAVDEFIALVHEWSRSNPDGMFDIFDESLHAKKILAALNYDRLLSARTRTICHC